MKKLLLVTASIFAFVGAAVAADLPELASRRLRHPWSANCQFRSLASSQLLAKLRLARRRSARGRSSRPGVNPPTSRKGRLRLGPFGLRGDQGFPSALQGFAQGRAVALVYWLFLSNSRELSVKNSPSKKTVPFNGRVLSVVAAGFAVTALVGMHVETATAQGAHTRVTAVSARAGELSVTHPAATSRPVSELAGRYFVDFRARTAASYGHAFLSGMGDSRPPARLGQSKLPVSIRLPTARFLTSLVASSRCRRSPARLRRSRRAIVAPPTIAST